MKNESFSLQARYNSFGYAFKGLKLLFSSEHNARIHLLITAFTIAACVFLKPTQLELIAVIFCIGLVFITELINTAIEKMADFVEPEHDERIGPIKDLAAAAVLVAALVSVAVGLLVFVPKLRPILNL